VTNPIAGPSPDTGLSTRERAALDAELLGLELVLDVLDPDWLVMENPDELGKSEEKEMLEERLDLDVESVLEVTDIAVDVETDVETVVETDRDPDTEPDADTVPELLKVGGTCTVVVNVPLDAEMETVLAEVTPGRLLVRAIEEVRDGTADPVVPVIPSKVNAPEKDVYGSEVSLGLEAERDWIHMKYVEESGPAAGFGVNDSESVDETLSEDVIC